MHDRLDGESAAAERPAVGETRATPLGGPWLAWLALVICEMLSQIALKLAGRDTGEFDFAWAGVGRALTSPWIWMAICTYLGAFLSWMLILRKSRLSAAFPTSAIVFIGVMFSSWLVLGETVTWTMVAGAALIVGGILLLGTDDEVQSHDVELTRADIQHDA